MSSFKDKISFIIPVLIVFQNISSPQGTWERMNNPSNENLSSVYFVDSLYGWAAGNSGTIIHTSNGGDDWIIQDSKTENNILDIFFLDRNLGWAVTWEVMNYPFGTYVLKTTNGGLNWISSTFPEENIFSQCILFQDSLNGWMGGKPFPIVRTIDGGNTWSEAEIDSSTYATFPVYDIQFYNSKIGYASGGVFDCCGIMWRTTNGGNYWFVADTPNIAIDAFYQLFVFDSMNVISVGGDFEPLGYGVELARTSNGGITWEFNYIGIEGAAWDIDFRTSREAWASLRGNANLIYSSDSGINWTQVQTPDSALIFNITFPDSLHGFGVGSDGAIIKYKPDSTTNVVSLKPQIPEAFYLEQNYPNPFNPTTNIGFRISERGFVSLNIYDVLGSEVATLVNEELAAGSYEINFDAGELSGGIYFYILSMGNYYSSKKMILLH